MREGVLTENIKNPFIKIIHHALKNTFIKSADTILKSLPEDKRIDSKDKVDRDRLDQWNAFDNAFKRLIFEQAEHGRKGYTYETKMKEHIKIIRDGFFTVTSVDTFYIKLVRYTLEEYAKIKGWLKRNP